MDVGQFHHGLLADLQARDVLLIEGGVNPEVRKVRDFEQRFARAERLARHRVLLHHHSVRGGQQDHGVARLPGARDLVELRGTDVPQFEVPPGGRDEGGAAGFRAWR